MPIGWTQLFVAVVALASTGGASALGFGPIRSSVTLGQPLNLAVPVNLAEGETLSADCAGAEVTAGEIKLPPGTVRVRVTQGRDLGESVLRVTTTVVVEEPVLTVVISAGCPTRLTRELLLLADPPLLRTASEEAEAASPRAGHRRAAASDCAARGAASAGDTCRDAAEGHAAAATLTSGPRGAAICDSGRAGARGGFGASACGCGASVRPSAQNRSRACSWRRARSAPARSPCWRRSNRPRRRRQPPARRRRLRRLLQSACARWKAR